MARSTNRLATPEAAGLRLDRWLWHARFYKSRALATAAVEAGRVKVNGARAKPSRAVRIGDQLELSLSGRLLDCEVLGLPVRRGPAPEARLAYAESERSIERGRLHAQNQRLGAYAAPRPDGRPDKKERRALLALGRAQAAGDAQPPDGRHGPGDAHRHDHDAYGADPYDEDPADREGGTDDTL